MQFLLTRAVKALLILNFVLFIVQHTADQFFGTDVQGFLALTPDQFVLQFRFWQILTYCFLHADVSHLFLNLLMLLFIGGELENQWGTFRFVKYYLFCAFSAGVCYLFMQLIVDTGFSTPMLGASGAIFGLLSAYGIIFGERTLLFMLVFPMKAKHMVWILGAIEFMSMVFSPYARLSSVAHLGGMIAGVAYLWIQALSIRRKRENKGKRRSFFSGIKLKKGKSKHLKLVINNSNFEDENTDDHRPKTWH